MNNQEAFNTIATHLLKQGKKSISINPGAGNEYCAYRGKNGLKCAIGCLIPDELYDSEFEGSNVTDLFKFHLSQSVIAPGVDIELLSSLQVIHDTNPPAHWRNSLDAVALVYSLDASCLKA